MGKRDPSALRRTLLRSGDTLSTRPVAALVFALSIAGVLVLAYLDGTQAVPLQAVVHADPVEVRSSLTAQVVARQVAVGDTVDAGQALLTLDTTGTQRELDLVERELAAVETQRALEAATLLGDGQLDAFGTLRSRLQVEQTLRVSRARTGALRQTVEAAAAWRDNVANLVQQGVEPRSALLEAERALAGARAEQREAQTVATTSQEQSAALGNAPTNPVSDVVEKQEAATRSALDHLKTRRDQLVADLDRATVLATAPGRVAWIAPIGATSASPTPLVRIVPPQSLIVVAYLLATDDQRSVPVAGQPVSLGPACTAPGTVERVGPAVEAAPEQLVGWRPGARLYGLPIFVKLPADCPMKPGFVLSIELLPP